MHLPAKADACHLAFVTVSQQFLQTFHRLLEPVFRILLRPPRMREKDRILAGYNFPNLPFPVHQKQFDGRCPQVHSYIEHIDTLLLVYSLRARARSFLYITSFIRKFQQNVVYFFHSPNFSWIIHKFQALFPICKAYFCVICINFSHSPYPIECTGTLSAIDSCSDFLYCQYRTYSQSTGGIPWPPSKILQIWQAFPEEP